MATMTTSRRTFIAGSTAAAATLALKYSPHVNADEESGASYAASEDLMRAKWQWDRVVKGTHGTNCTGTCAFNVYVKNGIVWREEQQGEYGAVGDTPDFGPRGCQKGLRHAKYMYGKQRILYPMKRVGERGEGRWERITWEQGMAEVADRFIDYALEHGPRSISIDLGTQMVLKRASFAALGRFATMSGVQLPEAYAGVGDLPTGVYMTVGEPLLGDMMSAVYKSRCCLIWYCNPAVTRIPDAHFFWEARYNGTEVISISPEFTPTAMHSSKWLNPKPGTDTALAMGMIHVILQDRTHDVAYIREQTDLPFLVRKDNGRFLRETDLIPGEQARDNLFFVFDEASGRVRPAPATGNPPPPPGSPVPVIPAGSLELGDLRPAVEGSWEVPTPQGPVEVTTVFELVRARAAEYSPERVSEITGLHPDLIVETARTFARAKPAMIFTGYRACKWLHGDLLQRAFMLLLSLTGNLGREGGGLQLANLGRTDSQLAFMFEGQSPTLRIATLSRWDYVHNDGKELNRRIYGDELAEKFDAAYRQSIENGWFPDYGKVPWKMGFFAGSNTANWRANSTNWRKNALEGLEVVVTLAPDMGITAMYSDYVFPIAHHYERQDYMLESRTPYLQVLDAAVPPLGEAVDDWRALERLAKAISERAKARGVGPVMDEFFGTPLPRDLTRFHDIYTMDGEISDTRDVIQFLIDRDPGVPKKPFEDLAEAGITRNEGAERVIFSPDSPYHTSIIRGVAFKEPYATLTGRQQYYMDHEWFLAEDEALPAHRDPIRLEEYPLQMLMGHVRHGIHSMWVDDPLLVSLRRGEPDIYMNPDDARERDVADGDLVRVYNSLGSFIALAHVSSAMQPGMLYMYHGWDPMMFRGRANFSSVISTAALIKPTSIVGGYGHVTHVPLAFEPNMTYQDFTCDFEKYEARAIA